MELRQIHYFIAIAEAEHFGRASLRLRIAQPALTRQIKLLEGELGIDLFERLPRGVRLTAAGRVFLVEARKIRAQVQQAIAAARAAAAGKSGSLRLGFIEVSGWHGLVPDGIRRFRAAFPEVTLSLAAMPTGPQLAALRQGQIDVALVYNPPPDEDLSATPLVRHPVVLAVPVDDPLAGRETVTLAALAGRPFVGFQRSASPRYFDELHAGLHGAGFTPHYIAELTAEADMLALVSTGAGIALVNSCQRWRQPPGVRFLRIEDLSVHLNLALVHPRDDHSPIVPQFAAILTALARDETGARS